MAMRPACILFLACGFSSLASQPLPANRDEGRVPSYGLPDPLVLSNNEPVRHARTWNKKRSKEILALLETQMFGRIPPGKASVKFEIRDTDRQALGGKAVRKQAAVHVRRGGKQVTIDVLMYLPNPHAGKTPCFLGLNFEGNHAVHPDTGIFLCRSWMPNDSTLEITENRATEASRGSESSRWPVERILERGYGVVTAYYGDMDPDYDDGFQNGLHPLFYRKGQSTPDPDQWGSIGAWAWGLSRILDLLKKDPDVDEKRIAVIGHSRLGKAALWAGARDKRFAMVVSNNSGCGGAALSKRIFGETVALINDRFPHWFCGNFRQYNDREDLLPFDQHFLLALIAPRPLYVASAEEDWWADPKGEFLSALFADPVYRLLAGSGLGAEQMPDLNKPVMDGLIGYHIRTGAHDVTLFDWERYMDFADRWMK
ncbi:acetylxylan esterase [bacterium]|nr:acetylxylan esterase [bacterium]